MQFSDEASNLRSWKRKPLNQKAALIQSQRTNVKGVKQVSQPLAPKTGQKALRKSMQIEVPLPFQQPERSASNSLPDSSTSGYEYRALRRKYLLLEEESSGLERELREVEDEVKILEDEKIALLDQLVVLEGLINPSESKS